MLIVLEEVELSFEEKSDFFKGLLEGMSTGEGLL